MKIFTFDDIKKSVEVGLTAGGADTFWLDEEEKKKREEEAQKYRMQLIEEAKQKANTGNKEPETARWNPISEKNQKDLDEYNAEQNSINWKAWAHGLSSGYSSVDQAMNPVFDTIGNTVAEGVQRAGQGLRWVDEVTGAREFIEKRNPHLKESWEKRDEFLDTTIENWQNERKDWNVSQVPENAGKGVLRAGVEGMQAVKSGLDASASFLTQPFLDEEEERRFAERLANNSTAQGLRNAKEWTMPDEDAGLLGSFANYTAEWMPAGGAGSAFGKGMIELAERLPKVGKGITGLSSSTKTLSAETLGVLASTPAYVAIKRQGDENEMSFWEEVKQELIFDILGTAVFHFGGQGVKKIFEKKGIDSATAQKIANEIEPQRQAEIEMIQKGVSEIPELKEFGEKRVISHNDFEQMRGSFLEQRRTQKHNGGKQEGLFSESNNGKKEGETPNNLSSPLLEKLKKQREEKMSKTPEKNRVKHDEKQGIKQDENSGVLRDGKEKMINEAELREIAGQKATKKLEKKESGPIDFLKSKWLKNRARFDDKEIFVKKLEEVEGVKKQNGESFYDAEQLMHGRIDSRVDEGFERAYEIDRGIRETASTSGKKYQDLEREVNEVIFVRHAKKENLKVNEDILKKEFSPEAEKIADEILEFHAETAKYLQKEGYDGEFLAKQKMEKGTSIGVKTEKLESVPANALENAVFSRTLAVQLAEKNRVKRELYTMWENNKENEAFSLLFDEVKEMDLDKYLEKVFDKWKGKKKLLRVIKDHKKLLEKLKKAQKEGDTKTEKEVTEDLKAKEKFDDIEQKANEELNKKQGKVREKIGEIKKRIEEKGLTDEVNKYLTYTHSIERNVYHQADMTGIDNLVAKAGLERLSKHPQHKEIVKLGNEVKKENEIVLKRLHEEGLIEGELVAKLKSIYPNHIPLKRDFGEFVKDAMDAEVKNGDIHNVKKGGVEEDPVLRAVGSDEEIADILENVLYFRERAEKLVVQKKLNEDLEKAIKDEEIRDAERAKKEAQQERDKAGSETVIEKANEKIDDIEHELEFLKQEREVMQEQYRKPLEFFRVKIDGDTKILRVKNEMLAKSVNSAFLDDLPAVFLSQNIGMVALKKAYQATSWGTNMLGRFATSYNPVFTVTNAVRDAESFFANYSAMNTFKSGAGAVKEIPAHWKTVFEALRGVKNKDTALYDQFMKDGSSTGGFAMSLLKSDHQKSWKAMKEVANGGAVGNSKHFFTAWDTYFTKWNEIAENATRFAAYKESLAKGKTRKQAALDAKNITVNFNKSGYVGKYINQLYLFANAALQGTKNYYARSRRDGRWNPRFFAIAGGVMATGWLVHSINDSIDPDWREKVTQYELEKTWVLVNPWSKDGEFEALKIPKSLEFNSVTATGDSIYEFVTGRVRNDQAFGKVAESLVGTADLLGMAGTWEQKITPTFFRPLEQAWQNVSWHGGNVVPDMPDKPEREKYYSSLAESATGRGFIGFSQFLYNTTGWDTSPHQWKNLVEQYTSGTGRTIMQVTDIAVNPENTTAKKTPFVNQFVAQREGKELDDLIKRNRQNAEEEKRNHGFGFLNFGKWQFFQHKEGAVVVRVIDADTVQVMFDDGGLSDVRLYGVDTPESVRSGYQIESTGLEATSFTKQNLKVGQEVEVIDKGTDKYDRKLAFLEVQGGENFSEILVREGMARVYDYENQGGEWFEKLEKISAEAKENELGIFEDGNGEKGQKMEKEEMLEWMRKIAKEEQEEENLENLSGEEKEKVLARIRQREVMGKIQKLSGTIESQMKNPEVPQSAISANREELRKTLELMSEEEVIFPSYGKYKRELWMQWYALEEKPMSDEDLKKFSAFWETQMGEKPNLSTKRKMRALVWENNLEQTGETKEAYFEKSIEQSNAVDAVKALRKMRREGLLTKEEAESMIPLIETQFEGIQKKSIQDAVFMSVKDAKEMGWE